MKLRRNSSKTLRQSTNTYTHASANPLSTPRSEHTNTHTHTHLGAAKPANKQLTAQEFQTKAIITTNNTETDS